MKRILFLASAWVLTTLSLNAQTTENFNSRSGVQLSEVKPYLQNHCWTFVDFNSNTTGWNPAIGGDGAMVSETTAISNPHAGVYTPMLEVPGYINISFKYRFSSNFSGAVRRWMKIYLLDANNEIQSELDNVEFTNTSSEQVYTYNKSFGAGSGAYKVFISYQGVGGSTKIAIDEVNISAPTFYAGGCNTAPVAVNDVISGTATRTATGHICLNDYDPNGESFDCYVITNSPHGTVEMNADKSFSFTPNPGFTGNSTTFTYQICDQGAGSLCSNIATVTINFPTGGFLPVSMIDFTGIYKNEGNVELNWVTTFEQNSNHFDVERSFTGTTWEKVGTIKAQGVSTVKKEYRFNDNVGRNTANKKDIYYRLKMADADGKVAVSRILVVRVYNTKSTKMISVSPNPAKNDIVATLQLNEASVVVLKVVNNAGNEVMRKSLKLSQGVNTVIMEGTSKLSPGMYIMEVIVNSSERMLVKLIKE
ncbi:MAG: cadherin-like domain-containing protein [Chitinophagaceae bacterium]|nr:cadherin-like domain-containing protein [Chitinophagaceae bacterium]